MAAPTLHHLGNWRGLISDVEISGVHVTGWLALGHPRSAKRQRMRREDVETVKIGLCSWAGLPRQVSSLRAATVDGVRVDACKSRRQPRLGDARQPKPAPVSDGGTKIQQQIVADDASSPIQLERQVMPMRTKLDLKIVFFSFTAVDAVDFAVQPAECFGFLGPNGAGKTTIMRMIHRASPVSSGELWVLGEPAHLGTADRAIKSQIGVVPQEDNLDQELSVLENLLVFCRFYGLRGRAARLRCDELLEGNGLTQKTHAQVGELSGGMKQRVLIARGLIGQPHMLVLDEPTTGLDPQMRHLLWEKLQSLRKTGMTLLLTTHYMEEAERLCDRLVILDAGKIVAEGKPKDLIAKHVPPFVVEISLGTEGLGAATARLADKALRWQEISGRVLLYVHDGEAMIAEVAKQLPDQESLVRRANLEDVFLTLTGHRLEG